MITLTEAARNKVDSMLAKETPDSKLRMFVYGKGCAGLTYGFDITNEIENKVRVFLRWYFALLDEVFEHVKKQNKHTAKHPVFVA